jgi:hypothetical protein
MPVWSAIWLGVSVGCSVEWANGMGWDVRNAAAGQQARGGQTGLTDQKRAATGTRRPRMRWWRDMMSWYSSAHGSAPEAAPTQTSGIRPRCEGQRLRLVIVLGQDLLRHGRCRDGNDREVIAVAMTAMIRGGQGGEGQGGRAGGEGQPGEHARPATLQHPPLVQNLLDAAVSKQFGLPLASCWIGQRPPRALPLTPPCARCCCRCMAGQLSATRLSARWLCA